MIIDLSFDDTIGSFKIVVTIRSMTQLDDQASCLHDLNKQCLVFGVLPFSPSMLMNNVHREKCGTLFVFFILTWAWKLITLQ